MCIIKQPSPAAQILVGRFAGYWAEPPVTLLDIFYHIPHMVCDIYLKHLCCKFPHTNIFHNVQSIRGYAYFVKHKCPALFTLKKLWR